MSNGIGFILGSAQLLLFVIYKNKSPSKSKDAVEEEEGGGGSAQPVKGVMQMEDFDNNEKMKTVSLNQDAFGSTGSKDLELGVKENL